ncbi:unnamed protein product [Calypogeia fissa]
MYSSNPEHRLAESVRRSILKIHHLERKRHMITVKSLISYAREGAYMMNISLGSPPRNFLVDRRKAESAIKSREITVQIDRGRDQVRLLARAERGIDNRKANEQFQTVLNQFQRCSPALPGNAERCLWATTDTGSDLTWVQYMLALLPVTDQPLCRPEVFLLLGENFWKASTESSQLLFGSLAAANSFRVNFTTLIHNQMRSSNHYVDLEDIAVDGVPLGISPTAFQIKSDGLGGTFLDTGTTVTHLVRPAYEALLRTLKSTIHYPIEDGLHLRLELCFNMSGISSPTFPSIRLQFKGADLDLPSDNTFISVGHKRAKCLAILPSEHFNVIGSIQMQDFKFLIEVEFSRIGFKREECGEVRSEF